MKLKSNGRKNFGIFNSTHCPAFTYTMLAVVVISPFWELSLKEKQEIHNR